MPAVPAATRPPLRDVPAFLRCTVCAKPFRATGSFLEPRAIACVWCGHAMRLVPRLPAARMLGRGS